MALGHMFYLSGYKGEVDRNTGYLYIIFSDNPVEESIVAAAWAYAIKNTHKGLEEADHEAALNLMLERHPSWRKLEYPTRTVKFIPHLADNDV